jgi:MSHA pilin protein MshA
LLYQPNQDKILKIFLIHNFSQGNKMFNKSAQQGFTIIELIILVVVMGIIAAIALPKYTALVKQSRISVLSSVQNSVTSLTAMTSALASGASTYTMPDGSVICMKNGYPDVVDGTICKSICSFIALSGIQCFPGTPDTNTASFKFTNDVTNCNLQYSPTNSGPSYNMLVNGC